MQPDDDICYCYHVSLRKLVHYARRERPRIPSQMTECLGAGTGCGWCIPILCKIAADPDRFQLDQTPDEYAAQRAAYRQEKRARHDFEPSPPDGPTQPPAP